jgi:hypothetical protein
MWNDFYDELLSNYRAHRRAVRTGSLCALTLRKIKKEKGPGPD